MAEETAPVTPTEEWDEEGEGCLTTLDACPGCDAYYTLYETAPNPPEYIALDDAALEHWEEDHDYNVMKCSVCGNDAPLPLLQRAAMEVRRAVRDVRRVQGRVHRA